MVNQLGSEVPQTQISARENETGSFVYLNNITQHHFSYIAPTHILQMHWWPHDHTIWTQQEDF